MNYDTRFHSRLHEVDPWRRREVARNTGVKCERSEYPKSYKLDRARERDARLRTELWRELNDRS